MGAMLRGHFEEGSITMLDLYWYLDNLKLDGSVWTPIVMTILFLNTFVMKNKIFHVSVDFCNLKLFYNI